MSGPKSKYNNVHDAVERGIKQRETETETDRQTERERERERERQRETERDRERRKNPEIMLQHLSQCDPAH